MNVSQTHNRCKYHYSCTHKERRRWVQCVLCSSASASAKGDLKKKQKNIAMSSFLHLTAAVHRYAVRRSLNSDDQTQHCCVSQ